MNKYNVSFTRPDRKKSEKNQLVEAMTEADAKSLACQKLGVADDRFRISVKTLETGVAVAEPELRTEMAEAARDTIVSAAVLPSEPESQRPPVAEAATDEAPPIPGAQPSPTLADLGIDGETAELLDDNNLTDLDKITAFGDLTQVKGIGASRAAEVTLAINAYLGS